MFGFELGNQQALSATVKNYDILWFNKQQLFGNLFPMLKYRFGSFEVLRWDNTVKQPGNYYQTERQKRTFNMQSL